MRLEALTLWCEFVLTAANPLRRSCVSKGSRCGAVRPELGEPSAEIVRVEALSLWRCANLSRPRRTLCGDCVCRSALAVAPCELVSALYPRVTNGKHARSSVLCVYAKRKAAHLLSTAPTHAKAYARPLRRALRIVPTHAKL